MNRRPRVILPLSAITLDWLFAGGRFTRGAFRERALYRWQSYWFERSVRLQRRLSSEPVQLMAPVFVMGLWRSGTTFLHELLSVLPGYGTPRTWHCMNAGSFRIAGPPTRAKAVRRPMDEVMINPWSPQEDEFALLQLGVPTVYRGFLDPSRLTDLACWLDLNVWQALPHEAWSKPWLEFLGWVRAYEEGRLVLKSPSHIFRSSALDQLFLDATYIWIVRDPRETFLSNRKMWSAMFKEYALRDCNPVELDAFLLCALHNAGKALSWALDNWSRKKLIIIEFDDLVTQTLPCIWQLRECLHLGELNEARPILEEFLRQRAGFRRESYEGDAMPSEAKIIFEELASVQARARDSHGPEYIA
jgi:hypothetical protein